MLPHVARSKPAESTKGNKLRRSNMPPQVSVFTSLWSLTWMTSFLMPLFHERRRVFSGQDHDEQTWENLEVLSWTCCTPYDVPTCILVPWIFRRMDIEGSSTDLKAINLAMATDKRQFPPFQLPVNFEIIALQIHSYLFVQKWKQWPRCLVCLDLLCS